VLKISKAVKWRNELTGTDDLSIVGKIEVGGQAIIKKEVSGDRQLYDLAKQTVIGNIYDEVYGDMDKQLERLELMLRIVLPPEYVVAGQEEDGPLAIVRNLQAELQARK
jgi:hypothetical protein